MLTLQLLALKSQTMTSQIVIVYDQLQLAPPTNIVDEARQYGFRSISKTLEDQKLIPIERLTISYKCNVPITTAFSVAFYDNRVTCGISIDPMELSSKFDFAYSGFPLLGENYPIALIHVNEALKKTKDGLITNLAQHEAARKLATKISLTYSRQTFHVPNQRRLY